MVVFIPRVPYMQLDIRVLTSARCQVRVADLQLALLFQSPHPAIPHLPTCPTKTHPARKFAQFSSYLPNWSHFMAWCPRGWHSCHVAANMWRSTSRYLLGAQRKEQLSSCPGTHCSLMLRRNLPARALLHGVFHNNPFCIWGPALHFAWKITDSLAYHLLYFLCILQSKKYHRLARSSLKG